MGNGNSVDLYRKHRPSRFKDVLGQSEAVAVLSEMVKNNRVPHAVAYVGPSGTGKTTIARIVGTKLGCSGSYLKEINAAESRGIDTIREIEEDAKVPPLGDCKVKYWILDELHRATGDSMSALLKILEDPKEHAYFAICTTEPQKLLKTLRTRCIEIKLNPFSIEDCKQIVNIVASREGMSVSADVVEKIAECSESSARKALRLLEQIYGLPGEKEMLAAISRPETERTAYDLTRALVWEKGVRWKDIQKILTELQDGDWEGIRHLVLKNAMIEMLKPTGNAQRAYLILDCFSEPFYNTGKPGLVKACYMVKCDSES